ncbi:hypothetical protein IIA79_04620 [bacterium]|nr:hypothetical protein [bacterium]
MNDGENVLAQWSGIINVLTPLQPGHANLLELIYDFQSFSWQNDGHNAVSSKSLLITAVRSS